MESTFPPHPESPVLCTQQVPMRFFRNENESCCHSVLSASPQSYISAEIHESSADRSTWKQLYLLESEHVISSVSFRAQPILQDLSPSSKGEGEWSRACPLETQSPGFSHCGNV